MFNNKSSAVQGGDTGIIGLPGCQPSFRFNERPPSLGNRVQDTRSPPLVSEHMHPCTCNTHARSTYTPQNVYLIENNEYFPK